MLKKQFGLVGHPLKHSHSSKIHQLLFKINNISASYNMVDVTPEKLEDKIKTLKQFAGFNVTAPYKTDIIKYLDDIDITAKKCNSVNTVANFNNKLIGFNTDILGFAKSIEIHKIPIHHKICVLGFGGAAKSIIYYLTKKNANITVAIRNYSKEKEQEIKKFFNNNIFVTDINYINDKYNLLINTTPVGMFPNIDQIPVNKKILKNINYVFDIIYNPPVTTLIKSATENGCKVFNGEFMLIWQAIEAQKIWFCNGGEKLEISKL